MTQTLAQKFDALAEAGVLTAPIPACIIDNLAVSIALRPYQERALERLIYYMEKYPIRQNPAQLLFHMATGSGKTVLMAALILYLYSRGQRNFLFFVNSSQIIEKTRDNFLNPASSKYLFAPQIRIDDALVDIRAVDNFDEAVDGAINIHFTTIQGLHRRLQYPSENAVTYEDFEARQIVLISDEAHHLNAETKAKPGKEEEDEKVSWENTVTRIWAANPENLLLEFTATVDLSHPAIGAKYHDKILYDYALRQFREDGYSKDIELRYVDLLARDRMLQAVVVSQFRRKLAAAHGVDCKPVILMKSKTIAESNANEALFHAMIMGLTGDALLALRAASLGDKTLTRAFTFIFDERGVSAPDLAAEIKLDFGAAKVENVNSPADLQARQIALNTLEDRDNELRVIFAVDKLNEGWDVLNLFDIVRLYDTRDGRENKVGKTTMQEAQLIGRGARYFPFTDAEQQDAPRAMRKYDRQADHPLRLLEQLHYHCSHNPKYIQDIKNALRETGMLDETARNVTLRVRDSFKQTDLYQHGHIWLNNRIKNPRDTVQGLDAYLAGREFTFPRLMTGQVTEAAAFGDARPRQAVPGHEPVTETWGLTDLGQPILRFALDTNPFFRFDRLREYFPQLSGMTQFITSDRFLGGVSVKVTGLPGDLRNLPARTKVEIAQFVLHGVETGIRQESVEYLGTRDFVPHALNSILADKTLKVSVQGETGLSWAESRIPGLGLIDLGAKDWHIYDNSYGTDQEKHFVRFIHDNEAKLKAIYQDFHLMRNEKLFQLYDFAQGRAFEPDFVLFLRRADNGQTAVMQVFIEPKGGHLRQQDQWKEDFLLQIRKDAQLETVFQGRDYTVYGLPFFNEAAPVRTQFEAAFGQIVNGQDAAPSLQGMP
jgi:type III restriction enzyme